MKGIHVIQRRKRKRKIGSPSLTLIPKHDPTK